MMDLLACSAALRWKQFSGAELNWQQENGVSKGDVVHWFITSLENFATLRELKAESHLIFVSTTNKTQLNVVFASRSCFTYVMKVSYHVEQ